MALYESISDKPAINAQIEKVLNKYPPVEQARILDALETLQNAGPAGISPKEWADAVKTLCPEGDFSVADLLKNTVKQFPCCVRRVGPGHYLWDDSDRGIEDVEPEVRQAVSSQVKLTDIAMKLMDKLGQFSVNDIAGPISRRTGMPLDQASEYVYHLIDQFSGTKFTEIGDGRYAVKPINKTTADGEIDNLKRLAGLPGMEPTDSD